MRKVWKIQAHETMGWREWQRTDENEESMCHTHNLNEFKYLRNFPVLLLAPWQQPTSNPVSTMKQRESYDSHTIYYGSWGSWGTSLASVFSSIIIVISPFFAWKQPSCRCLVKISNLCRLSASREILILFTQNLQRGGFIVVLLFTVLCCGETTRRERRNSSNATTH